MKYGTTVADSYWEDLMNSARERTNITGQRTKVVAVELSARAAKFWGRKYGYIICLPENNNFRKRCAKDSPNGRVCILDKNHHSPYHLARGLDEGTFLLWTFVSEYSRKATNRSTNSIVCETITAEQAEEMGFHVDQR